MDSDAGNETIVMTATFRAPDTPFLVVRDEQARLLQLLCALVSWAERPPKIIVRCFKCSRRLFETRLLDAYKLADDRIGVQIEQLCFNRLKDLDIPAFGAKPVLVGQLASTGDVPWPYDEDVIRTARSCI